jgi:dienelactone hydrolase
MTDVLLLHHIQGRTGGVLALADGLRAGGHTLHVPDVFDGRTFDSIEEGFAYAQGVGTGVIAQRGVAAAADLPERLAVIGISFGVIAAQQLAQQRPGVVAAGFIAACLPVEEFGTWPDAVPVQVHAAEGDSMFMEEGDLDAARALVSTAPDAELVLHPAADHLYIDSSLPGYDAEATGRTVERLLALLAR